MKLTNLAVYFSVFVSLGQCTKQCGPGSVYIYSPGQTKQIVNQKNNQNAPLLTVQDTQLVLEQLSGMDTTDQSDAQVNQIVNDAKKAMKSQDQKPIILAIDNMEPMTQDMFCTFRIDQSPDTEYYLNLFRALGGNDQSTDGMAQLEALAQGEDVGSGPKTIHVSNLNRHGDDFKCREYHSDSAKLASLIEKVIETHSSRTVVVISLSKDSCAVEHKRMRTRGHLIAKRDDFVVNRDKKPAAPRGPFSSKEQCEELTKNCAGHGSCVPMGRAESQKSKYHCACKSTYNKAKKQTTYWAGSACEKIDVSVATQMFLWTGIVAVFVIGSAIKLMFSINQEPLPGILDLGKSEQ